MIETNKIAIVTGASRGIGQAIALELGKQGITIAGTATTQENATRIDEYLKEHHFSGKGFVLDVRDKASIENTLASIEKTLGVPTILINNAGITHDNLMLRMKEEEWMDVIDVNLTAAYRMIKPCLRGMLKAQWGRIVNITSVVGATGNTGQANYSAAKAGIIGLTKTLAQEIASRNITVNAVAPGFIDTDMTRDLPEEYKSLLLNKIPLNRLGRAEEVASVVGFLVSPFASYVTGQTIHVNGGMYMSS